MNGTKSSVLALLPSEGLGGGIESFAAAALEELRSRTALETIALLDASHPRLTLANRNRFVLRIVVRTLRRRRDPVQIVSFHPALVAAVLLAQLLGRHLPPSVVILYGTDIWFVRRWQLQLLRLGRIRLVTISDFSAGAIAARIHRRAEVVPPTVDTERLSVMTAIGRVRTSEDLRRAAILTVFRLDQASGKGAYQLIEAVSLARRRFPELSLTIAGRGPTPAALASAAGQYRWTRLIESPSLDELSRLYHESSLFVLATRTKPWDRSAPAGEGFGLVLAEAQLTGLPVIAPASGGSSNAYVDGDTGLRPADESAQSLAGCLLCLLSDPGRYHQLSRRALEWAPSAFDAQKLGERLVSILETNQDRHLSGEAQPATRRWTRRP